MPIRFACSCGKPFVLPDYLNGGEIVCMPCRGVNIVPSSQQARESAEVTECSRIDLDYQVSSLGVSPPLGASGAIGNASSAVLSPVGFVPLPADSPIRMLFNLASDHQPSAHPNENKPSSADPAKAAPLTKESEKPSS